MVIDSSFNHIVNIEFDDNGNIFLHCQIMDWSKNLKNRLLRILNQLGTCYSLVEEPQIVKFNQLLGGKVVNEFDYQGHRIKLLRYN